MLTNNRSATPTIDPNEPELIAINLNSDKTYDYNTLVPWNNDNLLTPRRERFEEPETNCCGSFLSPVQQEWVKSMTSFSKNAICSVIGGASSIVFVINGIRGANRLLQWLGLGNSIWILGGIAFCCFSSNIVLNTQSIVAFIDYAKSLKNWGKLLLISPIGVSPAITLYESSVNSFLELSFSPLLAYPISLISCATVTLVYVNAIRNMLEDLFSQTAYIHIKEALDHLTMNSPQTLENHLKKALQEAGYSISNEQINELLTIINDLNNEELGGFLFYLVKELGIINNNKLRNKVLKALGTLFGITGLGIATVGTSLNFSNFLTRLGVDPIAAMVIALVSMAISIGPLYYKSASKVPTAFYQKTMAFLKQLRTEEMCRSPGRAVIDAMINLFTLLIALGSAAAMPNVIYSGAQSHFLKEILQKIVLPLSGLMFICVCSVNGMALNKFLEKLKATRGQFQLFCDKGIPASTKNSLVHTQYNLFNKIDKKRNDIIEGYKKVSEKDSKNSPARFLRCSIL